MKNSDTPRRIFFNRFVKSFAALSVGSLVLGTGRVLAAEDKTSISNKTTENNARIVGNDRIEDRGLSDLKQPDGLKYIGSCNQLDSLGKIEPEHHGQRVFFSDLANEALAGHLELAHDGVLYYDAKDTETPDDGVLCFVTATGKRWKRIDEGMIKLEWCDRGEEDKSIVLQRAIDLVSKKALASGKTYELPIIRVRAGRYLMMNSVHLPPYIQIQSQGSVTFDFSNAHENVDGFIINSESSLKIDALKMPGNNAPCLNGVNGAISILGVGRKNSQASALIIGNNKRSDTPCREVKFSNLVVTGWNKANEYRTIDVYLTNFRDCRLENNAYNLYVSGKTDNSGEKMSYENCVLGGSGNENIYIDADAFDFNFINCSFDFSRHDILTFDKNSGYQCVRFIGCHFEQWDGYVVNCKNALNNISVIMSNVIFLPRSNIKDIINSPSRSLFKLNSGVSMHLSGFEIRHEFPAVDNNIYMCADDKGAFDSIGYVKDPFPQLPRKDSNVSYHDLSDNKDIDAHFDIINGHGKAERNFNSENVGGTKQEVMSLAISTGAPLTLRRKQFKVEPGSNLAVWCSLLLERSNNNFPKVIIKLTKYDSDKNIIGTQESSVFDYAIYKNRKLEENSFKNSKAVLPTKLSSFKLDNNTYYVSFDVSITGASGDVKIAGVGFSKI
ncbi:hypothetical protein [Pantoea sp. B65]|uniref:hypothetical protein n=1 Tax=Pantoea sp. B65 TaxID=2813359 RepID=UPI0039B4D6F2